MRPTTPIDFKNAIASSGLHIGSPIEVGDPNHWIPTAHLETLLNDGLGGLDLQGLALRTRSKAVKTAVCEALGYEAPNTFKKSQPRFAGQQLDIYTQKSNNLQIWNEQLSPTRRYALIQISEQNSVLKVKVVNGQELALLDTTGRITTKYQAGIRPGSNGALVSAADTPQLIAYVQSGATPSHLSSPADEPVSGGLIPIAEVHARLATLVGQSFPDPGTDQERNRGAALHSKICETLGYSHYEDKGQFPDIRHQLLEVKLQTSPTIDLGLVLPNSEGRLDITQLGEHHPRHCDTRYAVFSAQTDGRAVTLTDLTVCTGADFFTAFRQFEGKVSNGKIQIPLPKDFFTSDALGSAASSHELRADTLAAPGQVAVLSIDLNSQASRDAGRSAQLNNALVETAEKIREGTAPPFPVEDLNGVDIGRFEIAASAPKNKPQAGMVQLSFDLNQPDFQFNRSEQLAQSVMAAAAMVGDPQGPERLFVASATGKTIGTLDITPPAPEARAAPQSTQQCESPAP